MDDETPQVHAPADRKFLPFTAGPYHVIEHIGDGGMGIVYLAEQIEPIQRLVTLKTVRSDMDVSGIVQRFEIERQNLARMNHPNIAQILDAGSLPDGKPYLVMEFVRGESLARYCFQKRLDIPSRLELIIEVCDAVQHAHQKGVVHKDLKPDNVLVTDILGRPHVKVIDFGISKLLDAGKDASTAFSAMSLFGTPQYMSPEQRGRLHLDVDTRTDVYSIGIVLYELLCSVVPVDLINMADESVELCKLLRPSEQVRQSLVDLSVNRRSKNIRQLAHELRGDLDAIVLKAIAVDRNDRYQTPSALAEDLRRYLARQPISLRRHKTSYVVMKLIRRHQVVSSVIAAATFAVALLIGLLASQVQTAELARRQAEDSHTRHLQMKELLVEGFRAGSPGSGVGAQLTARQVLEHLAKRIDESLTHDSRERAALLLEAARFFHDISEFDKAEAFARRAREAARNVDLLLFAESSNVLAALLNFKGKYIESRTTLNESLNLLEKSGKAKSDEALSASVLLSERDNLLGEYEPAMALSLTVIDTILNQPDGNSRLLVRALFSAAESKLHVGEWSVATELYKQAWELSRSVNGEDAAVTHDIFTGLAYARGQAGDFLGAERMWRQELAYATKRYGSDNQKTIATLANLGHNLQQQQRYDEAVEYLDKAHLGIVELGGKRHPDALSVEMNRAIAYANVDRIPEAISMLNHVLGARRELLGEDNQFVAHAEVALGETLLLAGEYKEAIHHIDNALAIFSVRRPGHWRTAVAQVRRGQALLGAGQEELAESAISAGLGLLGETLPEGHPRICFVVRDLQFTYAAQGRRFPAAFSQPCLAHQGEPGMPGS